MYKSINKQNSLVYFSKFSRKKFAPFNSLGKLIKISTLGVACTIIASPVQGQSKEDNDTVSKKLELEEVEVIGQKSTVLIDELPRFVELINAETIQNSPQQSFQDLLQYSSNVDVSQRGQFGIQSDISIRGGSFDQVLVLQNGINLTDPQTGHHNLNLPIDRESIYKIEILNGPAARAQGANAYTGAINIITKPGDKNKISASISTGAYGYLRTYGGINLVTQKTKHLISSSYTKSDGYIQNTDFKSTNFNYHGNYHLSSNTTAYTQLGFNTKGFGSQGFYTPAYPDQYEETSTFFMHFGIKTRTIVKLKADTYWRRHKDKFELTREHSDYYRYEKGLMISNNEGNTARDTVTFRYLNHHLTDIFGINLSATYQSEIGKTSIGTSLRSENILSNSLGNELIIPIPVEGEDSTFYNKKDAKNSIDMFVEQSYRTNKFFISAGALVHWNSFNPQVLHFVPGIDLSVSLTRKLSFVSSYNKTVGHPTFTDLQYKGPTNFGNENLQPYTQNAFESGLKWSSNNVQAGALVFFMKGKNNIDWVMNLSDSSRPGFQAMNIETSENLGTEFYFKYKNKNNDILAKFIHEVYLGYTYIETYRFLPENISKYSNIKHKAVLRIVQKPLEKLLLSWSFMHKQRVGNYLGYDFNLNQYTFHEFPDVNLIDVRATYLLKHFSAYAECSNLLDKFYVESGTAPQPGRWIKGGIKYEFGF